MADAQVILEFISKTETGRTGIEAYNTVYAHREASMPQPLVSLTVDEVISQGPVRARLFGSSAAGAYQIMQGTLNGLKNEGAVRGEEKFNPAVQDRLGLRLLRRRKFDLWAVGKISNADFALELAKEWASFPVLVATRGAHRKLSRGQSYYAGDGLNKALVKPEEIEQMLAKAKGQSPPAPAPQGWWARLLSWLHL